MRSHGHRIVVGLVGLITGRDVGIWAVLSVQARDKVEAVTGLAFFEAAPFDEINVIIECGEATRLVPRYKRMVTADGLRELPITVELEMGSLENREPDEVEQILRQALLDALLAIAAKYKLPADRLQEERSRMPTLVWDSTEPASAPLVPEPEPDPDSLPKLYRRTPQGMLYWETWETPDNVVVHRGVVGERGETSRLPRTAASRRQVGAEATQRRAEGYAEVPAEAHATVIVQYRTDGWGSEADLKRRQVVQDLLDNTLGWTGLGHCDGGDIGSGTTNIFCPVVDPAAAVPVIVRGLQQRGHLAGAIIAVEVDEEVKVCWPSDYQGSFSY